MNENEPKHDEWEDHSATNDLGINPGIIRCPFDEAIDVNHPKEIEPEEK